MPAAQIVAYKEKNGSVPFYEWLVEESVKVQLKALAVLRKLELFGYELRRPHADYLRDDIYELRFKDGRRNIRILYFFSGQNFVVVSHGLAKTDIVPPREIDLAVKRKQQYDLNPTAHTASFLIVTEGADHEEN